jgi:hypothetical protein
VVGGLGWRDLEELRLEGLCLEGLCLEELRLEELCLEALRLKGVPVKEVALEEEETRLEDDDRLELVGREEDVCAILDEVGDRVVESVEAAALLVEESELEEVHVLKEEGALDDVTPALLDIFVEVELFEVLVGRAADMEVAVAGAWVGKC